MFASRSAAFLLLSSIAHAQFPSLPDDVIVIDSELTPEVKLSYKQVRADGDTESWRESILTILNEDRPLRNHSWRQIIRGLCASSQQRFIRHGVRLPSQHLLFVLRSS